MITHIYKKSPFFRVLRHCVVRDVSKQTNGLISRVEISIMNTVEFTV